MNYFFPLILGFTAASIGVAPPGLLNMTAAKVSAVDGRSRAVTFALGASVTVLFQTYIAVLFAKFIDRNPDVVILLQEVGLFIFIGLTGYFFWAGKKEKKETGRTENEKQNQSFFSGDAVVVFKSFTDTVLCLPERLVFPKRLVLLQSIIHLVVCFRYGGRVFPDVLSVYPVF